MKTNDIYEQIVEGFKNSLKEGTNPFSPIEQPMNVSTERQYTGFNRWHLSGIVRNEGYTTSCFATYKQIAEAGGQIRKGEKGYPVFFWGTMFIFKGNVAVSANSLDDALKKAQKKDTSITASSLVRKTMFMKHFTAFNLDQADDIDYEQISFKVDSIGALIEASGTNVVNGVIPSYDVTTDELTYPESADVEDESLVLKSLIESTGHATRLNREFEYAEEELISTVGASFLAKSVGVEDITYDEHLIEKWLLMLEEKPMFLYKAASQAQKATERLIESLPEVKLIKVS